MAQLTWQDRDQPASVVLEAGKVVRIGRGGSNEISLDDPLVSRLHAEVRLARGHWTVSDLGSRNGTSRNGMPLASSQSLTHRDVIRCGSTSITFEDPGAEGVPGSQPLTLEAPEPPPLSVGERELLELLARYPGATTDELAGALHLTEDGVRQRLKRLYRKFEVGGSDKYKRARLVEAARLHGVVE